jgi:hypothetical protein
MKVFSCSPDTATAGVGASGEAAPAEPDVRNRKEETMKRVAFVGIAVLAIILGLVAYASADARSGSHPVTVNATVRPLFRLTIADTAVDLSADPDAGDTDTVAVSVQSNCPGTLTADWGGGDATADNIHLSSALELLGATGTPVGKGVTNYTDDLALSPDWNVDPTSVSLTLTYSAVQ